MNGLKCFKDMPSCGSPENMCYCNIALHHTFGLSFLTFLVTHLAAHIRNLLRVEDGIGQCCLPRSSNRIDLVAAVGAGPPTGLHTFRSCPVCATKFLIRVIRKSLSEIFLPPNEEKKNVFRMARSNRWKKSFFVHFHVRRLME